MFQSNGKIAVCPGEEGGGGAMMLPQDQNKRKCAYKRHCPILLYAGRQHDTVQSTYIYNTDYLYIARVRERERTVALKRHKEKTMQSHNYQVLSHFSTLDASITYSLLSFPQNLLLTPLTLQSLSLCGAVPSHLSSFSVTNTQSGGGRWHSADKTHFRFLSIFNWRLE